MDLDVIVTGFGPAGAIAAGLLGQAGIRTLVIEKRREIWNIPRAIALDHEAMRVFQNLGVVQEILPHTAPFGASEHFGVEGQLIRRIDAAPPPFPLGYPPSLVFTQPAVEAILRRHAESLPTVTVKLECEVSGFEQDAEGVTVHADQNYRARYLIGCDGAASTIRQRLGIVLEDLDFDEPWMVVDVLVNPEALERLPRNSAQYCDPARPTTFIVGPGHHRRWEIMLNPGEDPRAMERPENVWGLLGRWLTPDGGTLWRAGSYRFHALVAERWREGRVFLAGDAAHQQPPFIGQGMCQGIRDVANLCWKLREVLEGSADDGLLDTYGLERKEHVHTLTSRIKAIGRQICERDKEAARLRDEALLRQGGGVAPVITRQQIVPPLRSLGPGAASGILFPQPWVREAGGEWRLLDELAGCGWRLVLDGRRVSTAPSAPPTAIVIGGATGWQERDQVLAGWFDRYGCAAALVRPDHYVHSTAADPAELLQAAMAASALAAKAAPRRSRQERAWGEQQITGQQH